MNAGSIGCGCRKQGSRALSARSSHGPSGRTWPGLQELSSEEPAWRARPSPQCGCRRGGDAIEEEVFWNSADLFKLDVDLVFYDATTAWFETDDEDVASHEWRGLKFEPLRKRGHSKEGRDNDPQVIIALAVTRGGVPVRSWIFPGNTSDVATVTKIKDDLRAKEVIIGDGERRRRYILCLNEDEADRQKWRRADVLKTLKAELQAMKKDHPKAACRLVASKRFGRYLSLDDKGRPYLDKDKIKRAEHLDGKFVLTTNDDTLSVADIALGYKGMWIIESCFRKMKTTGLEVRPMFHWMPQRITAHVKLCVLALMIQRAAELRTEMTWTNIRNALDTLKAVSYRTEKQAIVQTTNPAKSAAAILKKLDITKPKTIISVS
jgi:transposase